MLIAAALSYHWVYSLQSNTPSHFTRLLRAVWMFQGSVSTMDPTEMSTQELLADTQKTNLTDDLNKATFASQTSDMDWDNQDVYSEEISLCQDYIDHYKKINRLLYNLKTNIRGSRNIKS